MASSSRRAAAKPSSTASRRASSDALRPGASGTRYPSSADRPAWRMRTAEPDRDPPERARAGAAAGSRSLEQIGQFSKKRL